VSQAPGRDGGAQIVEVADEDHESSRGLGAQCLDVAGRRDLDAQDEILHVVGGHE
jgi:hypothetical protein